MTRAKGNKTVPTTFNMDIDLKNKAMLYVTIKNNQLAKDGKTNGRITLSGLLNAALGKRLEKVEIRT